jgi:hypothetical protein
MSLAQRIKLVGDATLSLPTRAIATWYASGVEWGKERRIGLGDLGRLMGAFRELGSPPTSSQPLTSPLRELASRLCS